VGGTITHLVARHGFSIEELFRPRVFWLYLGMCLSGTLIVAFAAQFVPG
jgi:hypothetical protein